MNPMMGKPIASRSLRPILLIARDEHAIAEYILVGFEAVPSIRVPGSHCKKFSVKTPRLDDFLFIQSPFQQMLATAGSLATLSTMIVEQVDAMPPAQVHALAERILGGGTVGYDEALRLFAIEDSADVFDLLASANRIRHRFKGNKIHLCSIVNAKAGGCSENCSFCAQSAAYSTASPRYGFVDAEPVREAAEEAQRNSVTAVGLVAAWKGLNE